MPKYLASPGAEIIGSAMRALLARLNQDRFMPVISDVLASYNVRPIQDEIWYPFQALLDVFKRIAGEQRSDHNLIDVGLDYTERTLVSPETRSVLDGLRNLHLSYRTSLRHITEDEGYQITEIGERHIQVNDHTPFPHDMIYGFIWGVARRFRAGASPCLIWRRYVNAATPDLDGACYDVTW